jgi:hypothetical protein
MQTIFSIFSVVITAASGQVPARIPIDRQISPRVDVLFRNQDDGSLVPIPMVLGFDDDTVITPRHARSLRIIPSSRGISYIPNYTFQNLGRDLSDSSIVMLELGEHSWLNINPHRQLVADVGSVGKIFHNTSLTDSFVVLAPTTRILYPHVIRSPC